MNNRKKKLTRGDRYRRLVRVYWKEVAINTNLNKEQFGSMLKGLDDSLHMETKTNDLDDWLRMGAGAWKADKKGDVYSIYSFDGDRFHVYYTHLDDAKNTGRIYDAKLEKMVQGDDRNNPMSLVARKFEEDNGVSLKVAFDTVDEDFKLYVPKQFYYKGLGEGIFRLDDVSGVDFSSHYPSSMCGRLPDAHTAITVDGYVKPNEEYPFAFYPDTGHMAVYGELDTHEWLDTRFKLYVFRTKLNVTKEYWNYLQSPYGDDNHTILMKASEYTMDSVMLHFYNTKQSYPKDTREYKEAKLVLNAFIGNLHRKTYTRYKYAHLAAVCIARANDRMIRTAERLRFNDIIQICVDGLIYKGNAVLGGMGGQLGSLEQEFTGCSIAFKGINQYIVDLGNGDLKVKTGGFNRLDNGMPIEGNVHSLDDIARFERVDDIREIFNIKEINENGKNTK